MTETVILQILGILVPTIGALTVWMRVRGRILELKSKVRVLEESGKIDNETKALEMQVKYLLVPLRESIQAADLKIAKYDQKVDSMEAEQAALKEQLKDLHQLQRDFFEAIEYIDDIMKFMDESLEPSLISKVPQLPENVAARRQRK